MQARNSYTPEFKAKVVLEIIAEAETVNQIAAKYEISPVVLSRWKKEFLERALPRYLKKDPLQPKKNSDKGRSISLNLSAKWARLPMR